jgi:hypothetical protein
MHVASTVAVQRDPVRRFMRIPLVDVGRILPDGITMARDRQEKENSTLRISIHQIT